MEPPIPSPWSDLPVGPDEEASKSQWELIVPHVSKELRARIRETNYGRATGWIVEYLGEPIVLFTDCQYADMFWESYRMTVLTQDEAILAKMQDRFFFSEPQITFRNREFTDVPLVWHPIVHFKLQEGTAIVRGLYLVIDPPPPKNLWKRVLLWMRKS